MSSRKRSPNSPNSSQKANISLPLQAQASVLHVEFLTIDLESTQLQKLVLAPGKNRLRMLKTNQTQAIPSFTHMTLVALQEEGILKYLISQNVDGLHLRSGFKAEHLAELHGNRCLQKCKKCGSQFLRDFKTREIQNIYEHETSRKCQKCFGPLDDSIISFGESLPEYELNRSFEQAEKADLCLVLGSSLIVTPASNIPKSESKKGRLVIVNLQSTPLDKFAFMRINGLCQDVMKRLAAKMELKVKDVILKRFINFRINPKKQLEFRGIDKSGIPFSFFKKVTFNVEGKEETLEEQPYTIDPSQKGTIDIEFYRFLEEPNITLPFEHLKEGTLRIEYDPQVEEWVKREWEQIDLKKTEEKNEQVATQND